LSDVLFEVNTDEKTKRYARADTVVSDGSQYIFSQGKISQFTPLSSFKAPTLPVLYPHD